MAKKPLGIAENLRVAAETVDLLLGVPYMFLNSLIRTSIRFLSSSKLNFIGEGFSLRHWKKAIVCKS